MRRPGRRIAALGCLLLALGGCSSGSSGDATAHLPQRRLQSAPPPAAPPRAAPPRRARRRDRRPRWRRPWRRWTPAPGSPSCSSPASRSTGWRPAGPGRERGRRDLPRRPVPARPRPTWQPRRRAGRPPHPAPGLWMAVDQEGGQVQALKGPGFEPLPSAPARAVCRRRTWPGSPTGLGAALHDAGVNLDLAPVADVVPAGTERPTRRSAPSTGSTAAPPTPSSRPRER